MTSAAAPVAPSPYPPSEREPVTPTQAETRSIVRNHMLFAVGLFLLLATAYKLRKELEIIYVSALFAVVLMPVIRRITNVSIRGWKPQRWMAILFLIFVGLTSATLFLLIGLPPVIDNVKTVLGDLPRRLPMLAQRLHHIPLADKVGMGDVSAKVAKFFGDIGAYIVASLPLWLSHVFDILTTVFLCIYFMLEGEHTYNFFLTLFPIGSRRRLDITLKKAELKMSKWLIGQGSLMLILGVLSTAAYGALHVRYFILLGVLTGLLNIIPIVGALVSILLAGAVAALDSWTKMFGVFAFFLIYENLENAYLTPRIMRSSVNLMGTTVLVALLLGSSLAGIVGALVAVPTAALVSVLLEEYAVKR
jgi:predicted PurR-regulated permease PerM